MFKYITFFILRAMKNLFLFIAFAVISLLSGCGLIGGIFKAGVYTGILVVAVLIVLAFFIISKIRDKS